MKRVSRKSKISKQKNVDLLNMKAINQLLMKTNASHVVN